MRKYDPAEAVGKIRALNSLAAIAALLETTPARVNFYLFGRGTKSAYRQFEIPKKSGGARVISAPAEPLRAWQRILAELLRDAYRPRTAVHGFCLDRSIVSNAKLHVGRGFVLNLDLEDFFASIHFGRIQGVLGSRPFGLHKNIAAILAQLFCFNACLPQGSPASPALSNWTCRTMDKTLAKLASDCRCRYSRFADDITFSGPHAVPPRQLVDQVATSQVHLGKPLVAAISAAGFSVNERKVWLRTRTQRQEVTGLVVNRKVNVRRSYYREIRSALRHWLVDGYQAANELFCSNYDRKSKGTVVDSRLAGWLAGKIAHLGLVRGSDDCLATLCGADLSLLKQRDFGTPVRPLYVAPRLPLRAARHAIRRSLWLVLVRDQDKEIRAQGSAFAVANGKLVTCFHVIENAKQNGWSIEVRPAHDPVSKHYEAKVLAEHAWPLDLAVLQTSAPIAIAVALADQLLSDHSVVNIAGFSNWSNLGHTARIESTELVQIRTENGVTRIACRAPVTEGMSGGLMLQDGLVVGVLSDTITSAILPNSAISSRHLRNMLFDIAGATA